MRRCKNLSRPPSLPRPSSRSAEVPLDRPASGTPRPEAAFLFHDKHAVPATKLTPKVAYYHRKEFDREK
jgi:hypothetical protein